MIDFAEDWQQTQDNSSAELDFATGFPLPSGVFPISYDPAARFLFGVKPTQMLQFVRMTKIANLAINGDDVLMSLADYYQSVGCPPTEESFTYNTANVTLLPVFPGANFNLSFFTFGGPIDSTSRDMWGQFLLQYSKGGLLASTDPAWIPGSPVVNGAFHFLGQTADIYTNGGAIGDVFITTDTKWPGY